MKVRVRRSREQLLSDGKIAARWIAQRIGEDEAPTYQAAGDAFGRTKQAIKSDIELFLKEGDDETLAATIRNWLNSSNRAIPDAQKAALVDLFIEIRDSAHRWGFENEGQLSVALGVPIWTLRTWRKRYRPQDKTPMEFRHRVTYDDTPDSLFGEFLGVATEIDHSQQAILQMRFETLIERLEEIRQL